MYTQWKGILVGLLVVVFTGCAALSNMTTAQKTIYYQKQVVVACNGFAHVLVSLAAFRRANQLSPGQVNIVNTSIVAVRPFCTAKVPVSDPQTALLQIQSAMLNVLAIQSGFKGKLPTLVSPLKPVVP